MYYVGKNGSQSGPYPLDELKNMAASGQLAPADLVWTDGMSEWKPAGTALADLFPPVLAAAPPVSPFPAMPAAPSTPVYAASPPPPPATQQTSLPPHTTVSTFLWQSIAVTLLCCPPFGIPAIVYASQVDVKRQHGDLAGAVQCSKNAQMWFWIALGTGLLCNILGGLIFGNMAAALMKNVRL